MNLKPNHSHFCTVLTRQGTMHMALFWIFKSFTVLVISECWILKKYGTLTVCHGNCQIRCIFCHRCCQEKTARRIRVEHCARMYAVFMRIAWRFIYLLCLDIHLLLLKIIQTVKTYFFCVGKLFISCIWTLDKKYLCEIDWISLHNLSGLFPLVCVHSPFM